MVLFTGNCLACDAPTGKIKRIPMDHIANSGGLETLNHFSLVRLDPQIMPNHLSGMVWIDKGGKENRYGCFEPPTYTTHRPSRVETGFSRCVYQSIPRGDDPKCPSKGTELCLTGPLLPSNQPRLRKKTLPSLPAITFGWQVYNGQAKAPAAR